MSKIIYFVVMDLTKPNDSPDAKVFYSQNTSNDFAGVLLDFAKRNGTSPNDCRLFIYDTKKDWERNRLHYASRCISASSSWEVLP